MIFKSSKNYKNNDLAEQIFEFRTYQPYVKNCPNKKIKKICWDCNDIQDSLNKVIEYCEEPITPKSRFLHAIAYAYSRVLYNERAIYYLQLYLSNEPYDKFNETPKLLEYHFVEMYGYLINCYIKDLKYDKALEVCDYCIKKFDDTYIIYLKKADIYRRKNMLRMSCQILEEAKNNLKIDKSYLQVISHRIDDYKSKISKGYIFKTHSGNKNRIEIHSDKIYELNRKG